MRGELYACRTGGSNKYYLVIGENSSCSAYYGRIEALARGNTSNQYAYPKSVASQVTKKQRGWRKKGDDYQLVFVETGSEEELLDCAKQWARKGAYTMAEPTATLKPVLVTSGWFNNGD